MPLSIVYSLTIIGCHYRLFSPVYYPGPISEKEPDISLHQAAVLTHYEEQTEEEAVVEDEAAFENQTQTVREIPSEPVPIVRELIARHQP